MSLLHRYRRSITAAAIAALALVVFVAVYFQPQKLFIDKTVDEALPAAPGSAPPSGQRPADSVGRAAPRLRVLASGRFRSGEHHTTGQAQVLALANGSRLLRLTTFRTSNGPAVRVRLSAARAGASNDTVAHAAYLDLGPLKGNIGDQNYRIPRDEHLGSYVSALIWCRRFAVTFGSASLVRTGGPS